MKYEAYAELIGFKLNNGVYVKEINGFNVYLKDWQYMVLNIPSVFIPLDKPLDKENLKDLSKAALDNVCSLYTLGEAGDTLIVSLADGKKTKESVIDTILVELDEVTKYLSELGYKKMTKCPLCKNEGEYMSFGDDFIPTHKECKNNYITKLREEANKKSGFDIKYILSILLSLILGLIGVLPAFFWMYYGHYYFGGVLCLIPILAVLGYFLAKAPRKAWLKIVTGIIPMLIVISFVTYSIYFLSSTKEVQIIDFIFGGAWDGARKIFAGILFSIGGFGIVKFLDKYSNDPAKRLKKFKENE